MYLVLFILNDMEHFQDVMHAWEEICVDRITLIPSTGLGKLKKSALRDDLPLIPSLDDLFRQAEVMSKTFITIVDNEEIIEKIVSQTQSIIGDLSNPNTGILLVLPVMRAYGLHKIK